MHLHLPTDMTLLTVSPIAGVAAAFIFMIVFNIVQNRSNVAWVWQTIGVILMFAALAIGCLLPFIK